MYLTQIIILTIFCGTSLTKEEDSNELSPKALSLDMNLRKALLKALTELENEEKEKLRSNSDKTVEKALASSFTILATNPTPEVPTEKPIVVFQKSHGIQHKPIITFLPAFNNVSETEQFLTSATSRFTFPQDKAKSTSPIANLAVRPDKIELTPPTPTVASPTTEENEAKVEDVQFLSAPLVAAFTVHQDEHGLPKSVEPTFKPSVQVPVVTNFQEEQNIKRQQILRQEQFKQEHLRNQLALQEKQRILEEQLIRLQQQQKQQEEYLYKQQKILQEQLKIQSHKLQHEKLRFQETEQSFRTSPQFNANQITNTDANLKTNNQNAVVSFQSSISLNPIHKTDLPLNAQHLPIKNPVNFLQSPYIQPVFNRINRVLNPPAFIVQPTQKIFRREPVDGNFFNQNIIPLVQLQPPLHASNVRLLRSNLESYHTSSGFPVQPPVVNKQLNNLLYNSGITRGKQSEDLNIVSKILSYNHVGGDNFFGPFSPVKRSDGKI